MQNFRQIILEPCLSNVIEIENLIHGFEFNSHQDKLSAVLIVATEIFDNIVEHAKIPKNKKVRVEIRQKDCIELKFLYPTSNFDELLKAVEHPTRYIDNISNRYRGLGLIMVKNLSTQIDYEKSDPISFIRVRF